MSQSLPTKIYRDTNNLEEVGESPFIVEFIMVQCCGLPFMAYLDEAGKWRTAYEHLELPEQMQVLC